MLESKIKTAHKLWLQNNGWLVNHIIQCSNNGWVDTEVFKSGRCVHIEYKQPGEAPDPLQLYRHEQLLKAGFKVVVVDSMDFPVI